MSVDIIGVVFRWPAHFLRGFAHGLAAGLPSARRSGGAAALSRPARFRDRGWPVFLLPATSNRRHAGSPGRTDQMLLGAASLNQLSTKRPGGLRRGCDSLCRVCPRNAQYRPMDARWGMIASGIFWA